MSYMKMFGLNTSQNSSSSVIQNFSIMSDKTQFKDCSVKKHQTFYQRIEFLGDAFLDLVVVEYLYDQGGDYLDD